MNALKINRGFFNSEEFLMCLFGLSLSTLLIGYAYSSIGFGLFFAFALRYGFIRKTSIVFKSSLLLPILLYILFLASYLWSEDKDQTLKGIQRMLVMLIIPAGFLVIPKVSSKGYHLVLKIFTRINALVALFFLAVATNNYFETRSFNVFTYHELVEILEVNAIYASLVFAVCLFYLLSLKKRTVLEIALALLFILMVILLSSKMIIGILVIGAVVLFAMRLRKKLDRKKTILFILLTAVLISVGSFALYKRLRMESRTAITEVFNKEKFGKVYYWTGSSIRLFQLRLLKEQIEEDNIILNGFGLFASKDNLRSRHESYDTYYEFHSYNYHNQYAQMLAELGIIGLVLFLAMLFSSWKLAVRQKHYFFIMFSILMTFIFLTESILWRQRGLFLFIGLLALLTKSANGKNELSTNNLQ